MANTNRYWIANYTATPNFNVAANWADNADGSGANTAPTAGDMVHFGHATTLGAGFGFGSCIINAASPSLAQFTTYEGYNKVSFTGKFVITQLTRTFTTSPTKNLAELGFKSGMVVSVTGCSDAANNDTYVIQTVGSILVMANIAGGTSMANESAGNDVTITYDPSIDFNGQTITMNDTVGGVGTVMILDSKVKNSSGTGNITFAGAQVSGGNGLYYKCGENLIFENRDNVRMSFTPTGQMNFDNGIYPVTILNAGDYTCNYITPTSTVHNAVNFYKFTEATSAVTWVSGGTKRQNLKKIFNVENTTGFALLTKNFNTGQSTWSFNTDASFVIPTSGDFINYPTGFNVRWYNLIIKNTGANTARKATIPARRNLQVNSLTVEAGANVEGEKVQSLSGTKYKGSSTITSNTRPTIKGAWNFSQVADGVYASLLSESYSITPSHGDRGALQFSYGGGAFHSQSKIKLMMDDFATDWDAVAWLQACDGAYFKSSFYAFCQSYAAGVGAGNDTIWISNASPSVPYFTDSNGTKHSLIGGGGGGGMTSWSIGSTTGTNQTVSNGEVVDVVGGTGISGTIGGTRTVTLDLDDTAVTAATYGSATESPVIAIDAQGRITSASNASIPVTPNTDQKVKINALDSAAGFLEDKIIAGTGLSSSLALAAPFGTQMTLTNDSLAFKTIAVAGQTDVVADLLADTLTLAAGSNMTITTNATSDTITFASTGGGGGGGVTVQDEGVTLATTATTLNFVGAGVVASGTGATKTITIAGGGGAAGEVVEFVNSNTTINMNTTIAVCASNTDCTAKAGVTGATWAGMTGFGSNFENYDFTATSSVFGAAQKGLVDVPVPTVGRKLTLVVPFPSDGRSLPQGISQISCTGQTNAFIGHDLAGMVVGNEFGKATQGSNVLLPEGYLFGVWGDAGRRLSTRAYLGHHAITLVGVPAPTGSDAALIVFGDASFGDVMPHALWWVETNNEFLWDNGQRNAPTGFFDDRAFGNNTAWGQLYVVC